jgi:hypothetical protein
MISPITLRISFLRGIALSSARDRLCAPQPLMKSK